ncbi:hypothetical protein D3C78_940270 [compost metagenome]
MVGQVHVHGQQRATVVVQAARRAGGDGVEHRLVGHEVIPFRIALVQGRAHAAVEQRQRVGAFHPFHLAQLPLERIHLVQRLIGRAVARRGLHHDRQHVAGGAVIGVQVGDVAVVAAVLAQFRSARIEVADLQLRRDGQAHHGQRRSAEDGQAGPLALGEAVQHAPDDVLGLSRLVGTLVAQAA